MKSFNLSAHHSTLASSFHQEVCVEGTYQLEGENAIFKFKVSNPRKQWNRADGFGEDYRKNWELWNHDVVEVFLQNPSTGQYLELQCSVDAKPFALMIDKPRVRYWTPLDLILEVNSSISEAVWESEIKVQLPWQSSQLRGNIFCCLGPKEQRGYFALNTNKEDTPDFHRPELFKEL